jgi:hypothetical protein
MNNFSMTENQAREFEDKIVEQLANT